MLSWVEHEKKFHNLGDMHLDAWKLDKIVIHIWVNYGSEISRWRRCLNDYHCEHLTFYGKLIFTLYWLASASINVEISIIQM